MAPFLSFTAEEAWGSFGRSASIFLETFGDLGSPDAALLERWARIREIRDAVNKDIESLRAAGQVGSSLQATVTLHLPPQDLSLIGSLGEDARFVFITSQLRCVAGPQLRTEVMPSASPKCERCWHYRDDVGHDATHPTLCGRCTSNLYGAGEARQVA
jgi:isoleucyl-tRNA synthetase